ncbi:hypothetical protein HPP92_004878 [Vanilla planifolia]|uniref:Uncharacterized protein n=1 Tax=Vanilla planifolia TaxID=51239 RepID=A0A835RP89_VANPL|nr:hypothetical protein HPP92_005233 [Vanilla planifolia]KAG0493884.1 hypothetical protein HPP92_004878 [Vanilla planifolia]
MLARKVNNSARSLQASKSPSSSLLPASSVLGVISQFLGVIRALVPENGKNLKENYYLQLLGFKLRQMEHMLRGTGHDLTHRESNTLM